MIATLHHFAELLLGVPRDFLDKQGALSIRFNPVWPGQAVLGAAVWNLMLAGLGLMLVIFVYREDGRPRRWRICLGLLRAMLLAMVLVLLNRPVLSLAQSRIEPSVLAIMVDDSSSMRVRDTGSPAEPRSRLATAQDLLCNQNAELLRTLSKTHNLRLYRFGGDATPLAELHNSAGASLTQVAGAITALKAEADSTQVLSSILSVARDLQGQRVAGVVVLTDGRDTPVRNISSDLQALKTYGVQVYPIALGSDQKPKNIAVQSIEADDVAFTGDVVNVKTTVMATGFGSTDTVHLILKDKKTNAILTDEDGKPAETDVKLPDGTPTQVELHWKTSEPGNREVVVQAIGQPGEIDDADNSRTALITVLDAKIAVLYVDGYPRWDYRYLKNLLLRDKTFSLSCLLASADFDFLQEGNKPLPSSTRDTPGHFPDKLEQLMAYDVLVIGDADPRYFSDSQLQLISEFVSRGGGLMMVAGERWAPQAYRNTPIEALLPITLSHVQPTDPSATLTQGFRPVVSTAGKATGIYRFFGTEQANDNFLANDIPELFWYCRGITAKPSVGEVLAEHPTELGPDGRRAPLLVAGRFGGRTLFSAIDDSWRWRFYTDEHVFDAYWVQQIRYLARNRKINQRRLTLSSDQPVYELGSQVRLSLHVIDPGLVRELPDQIRVQVKDAGGLSQRTEMLQRQAGSADAYAASFTSDQAGRFTVQLPPLISGVDEISLPFEVILPRMELVDPRVDRIQLSRLASETFGKTIELNNAATELAAIPSAEKILPQISSQSLGDAPLSLVLFALLLSAEWVGRKLIGMA
jgi:uncharacterized membrane protein